MGIHKEILIMVTITTVALAFVGYTALSVVLEHGRVYGKRAVIEQKTNNIKGNNDENITTDSRITDAQSKPSWRYP